jgi:myo-inositol 2-dehydrogenase/D-chiro-inositol 1-dehydrogenase
MRAAVVGAGRIGSFHARNLAKAEDVEDVVVVDASDVAARALADSLRDTLGITVATSDDLARVLADGVDLVVVAAPTSMHTPLMLQCIESGTPVFCEKPGAVDLDEAARLVAAVDSTGVAVQIGFQRRFDPPIRAAAQARARGEVGHVYLVRSATHDHEPPDITYVAPQESLFTETLIHDIDAIRYVTGQEVVRVMSMVSQPRPEQTGIEGDVRHVGMLLQLDGGAQAVATAAWHDPCGYDVRLELLGSKDSVAVGYGDAPQLRRLDLAGGDDPAERRIAGFVDRFEVAYRDELQAFVDCVQAGEQPQVGVRDAYAALAVALAAWESHQSGEPVEVATLAVGA